MHFYEKMGYSLVGKIEPFGFEFNRWFNTIIIDKIINEPIEEIKNIKKFDEVRRKFGFKKQGTLRECEKKSVKNNPSMIEYK